MNVNRANVRSQQTSTDMKNNTVIGNENTYTWKEITVTIPDSWKGI